jgi:hypothetical protein
MSRRALAALALFASAGLGGLAFAQQRTASPERSDATPGRYAAAASGADFVLLDTATGKTWLLHPSADERRPAWLPVQRIDDPKQAEDWLVKEEAVKREQEERKAKEEAVRRDQEKAREQAGK